MVGPENPRAARHCTGMGTVLELQVALRELTIRINRADDSGRELLSFSLIFI